MYLVIIFMDSYTRFVWAGGTFFHFQLRCCISFLFWREIGCGFTYYLCTQEYRTIKLWCCVSFFGSGRKQFLVFRTHGTYCTLQQCGCVSFWFLQEIGFGFTYLCTQSTIQLWCCVSFWSWREIVIDVTYVLSVQYSCAVVSVFWLWREIVLKMRTRFYKKILLGYFIMIRQPMCVYKTKHSFTLNLSILNSSLVPHRFAR